MIAFGTPSPSHGAKVAFCSNRSNCSNGRDMKTPAPVSRKRDLSMSARARSIASSASSASNRRASRLTGRGFPVVKFSRLISPALDRNRSFADGSRLSVHRPQGALNKGLAFDRCARLAKLAKIEKQPAVRAQMLQAVTTPCAGQFTSAIRGRHFGVLALKEGLVGLPGPTIQERVSPRYAAPVKRRLCAPRFRSNNS